MQDGKLCKNMKAKGFVLGGLVILIALLLPPGVAWAQEPMIEQWVAEYNGPGSGYDGGNDIAIDNAIDSSGNVYVTGESKGSGTSRDYATIKYDSAGNELWVRTYNGPGNWNDMASKMALDSYGSVYVTGLSWGGAGTGYDYATVKYDSSGNQLWVTRYNGPGNNTDRARGIATDSSGNVYVTGWSIGSGTGQDYATVKYDSAGNQLWVKRYNGPGNGYDGGNDIAIDSSDNVYVCGYSVGGDTGWDCVTVKYNSAGNELWVARYNGPDNADDCVHAITVDGLGNVYVTGFTGFGTDSDSGEDYVTIKYDSAGNQLWVRTYNGTGSGDDEPTDAIVVDGSGNVYVSGNSEGENTDWDWATVKYDSAGNQLWVRRYNGPDNGLDWPMDLAIDGLGNIYVTGSDYTTVKYDSAGNEQGVARYNRGWGRAIAVDSSGNVYVTGDNGLDFVTIKYSNEPVPVAPWSFAVITDLHIGWGIPDYDAAGYNDKEFWHTTPGQDYYLTQRLGNAVQWINEHDTENNIKFVVVTGDIADTAEYSEFVTAREILNQLEIPYIPITGNHDIWPHTQKINSTPDGNLFTGRAGTISTKADAPLGEGYFERTFWNPTQTNTNPEKVEALFNDFVRQADQDGNPYPPYFQNYAFSYNGKNFIALDFASREYFPLLWLPTNAVNHQQTMNWFTEKLGAFNFVLTHYPFILNGGFEDAAVAVRNCITNCGCMVLDLAGHTHVNRVTSDLGGKLTAIETDATSQIPFVGWEPAGEFIRLVTVDGEDMDYGTLIRITPSAINPFFIVTQGEVGVGQEITLQAYTKNLNESLCSFSWLFEDGGYGSAASGRECKQIYWSPGNHKVTLTATVNTSGNSENLSWDIPVKETAKEPHKVLLPIPGLVPLLDDMDLTRFPQNTAEWATIMKVASAGKPIASLLMHFEEANEDIDLSGLVADIDLSKRKSVIHMDSWPAVIDKSKVLFIPSTGVGSVYVCPNAISLQEVTPLCEDVTVLDMGETENGVALTTITYDGQEYYRVSGIKCTGGGELGTPERTIKSLNDYIQGLPDGAFKNNPEQRKNALWNKLNEVWTKIDNQEYQEAINKLQNDVRAKADGDKKAEDWIVAPEAQREICRMVDELIAYISGL
ncbi:MAG: SBBP repeat-containing protein [Dehalococcoidia bacterium]|nr:SBBP repeat-containing protein [Dehalococcoidia bacterium]